MLGRVLIDTDVIIDVLRKKPIEFSKEALKRIEKGEFEGFVSVLTVFELYIGARMNPKPEKARERLDRLLERLGKLDVSEEIAENAGWKLGALYLKGIPVENIDMLLATTAEKIGADYFLTRNIKHYEKIEVIRPILTTPEKFMEIKHTN